MAEKRFILARDVKQANTLLSGESVTDNNGNEVSAGENSIVFAPETSRYSKGLLYVEGTESCSVRGIGTCTDTDIIIPEFYNGLPVTSVGGAAFADTNITSIEIPNTVTEIGYTAFQYCRSLKRVVFGNSVTSIGNQAFSYCDSLTSITIPDSVTTIGDSAFSDCPSLKNVSIGQGVTSIARLAFVRGTNLTSLTIGNSVSTIGQSAFAGCGMVKITIPKSVVSIGAGAFGDCLSLQDVIFESETPPTLGTDVFLNIPTTAKLIVPKLGFDNYKNISITDTNWSGYRSYLDYYAYGSETTKLYKYTLECYVASPAMKALKKAEANNDYSSLKEGLQSGLSFRTLYRHFSIDIYSHYDVGACELGVRKDFSQIPDTNFNMMISDLIGYDTYTATASGYWIEDFTFEGTLGDSEEAELKSALRTLDNAFATDVLDFGDVYASAKTVTIENDASNGNSKTFQIFMDMDFKCEVPLFGVKIASLSYPIHSTKYTFNSFYEVYMTKNEII